MIARKTISVRPISQKIGHNLPNVFTIGKVRYVASTYVGRNYYILITFNNHNLPNVFTIGKVRCGKHLCQKKLLHLNSIQQKLFVCDISYKK